MRFLIIGSGAIGTFVGAWIAQVGHSKGHEVVFIGREGGLIRRALQVKPDALHLTDCDGRVLELSSSKFTVLKDLPKQLDFDYILISGARSSIFLSLAASYFVV
jgi:ketopantoate reductase